MLSGFRRGRVSSSQVTVFDSVGFALRTTSGVVLMGETAADLGICDVMELVPRSPDPKDLFGVLRQGVPQAVAA